MNSVIFRGITYNVLSAATPQDLSAKYAGIAERMIANGVEKQLIVTNNKYPITFDERGQSSNQIIVYLKQGKCVASIEE